MVEACCLMENAPSNSKLRPAVMGGKSIKMGGLCHSLWVKSHWPQQIFIPVPKSHNIPLYRLNPQEDHEKLRKLGN